MEDERLEQCREVLDRLRPACEQEGLEVEIVGIDGNILNIRARRTGAGVPVAFLVRAIAGTFHRYYPDIEDVCLQEYDPGQQELRSSPEFDKVFKHRPPAPLPPPRGTPGVDLSGLDRAEAVRAIEAFVGLWASRVSQVKLAGLDQDAPLRAARKWAHVYAGSYHSIDTGQQGEGIWTVYFQEPTGEPPEPVEMMPGSVLLA